MTSRVYIYDVRENINHMGPLAIVMREELVDGVVKGLFGVERREDLPSYVLITTTHHPVHPGVNRTRSRRR